jgi:hypothetical protein
MNAPGHLVDVTAAKVTVEEVLNQVQLVIALDVTDRLLDPATCRTDIGITLVQLDQPHGVILPVRAGYKSGPATMASASTRSATTGKSSVAARHPRRRHPERSLGRHQPVIGSNRSDNNRDFVR